MTWRRPSRRASTNTERARVAVTEGIKVALQQIRAMEPELGRHQSTSTSTGYFCTYHQACTSSELPASSSRRRADAEHHRARAGAMTWYKAQARGQLQPAF